MRAVSVEDMQRNLAALLREAINGNQIVITESGRPLATLTGLSTGTSDQPKRKLGFLAGKISVPETIAPDEDQEILNLFGNKI